MLLGLGERAKTSSTGPKVKGAPKWGLAYTTFNDSNNLCKLFVGFKSSNQILDQLQILCRNLNS